MADSFTPVPVRVPKASHLSLYDAHPRELLSFKTYASHALNEAVAHVSVSPADPFEVAASHGFAVSLLPLRGGQIRKSFSRFRAPAYSPHFKRDGRLLVVGTGDGDAKVLNVDSGTPLREFRGHKAAVRSCRFTSDGLNVLTGSDDHTVRLWDLATGAALSTLTEAEDYVRCQNMSTASSHVWITGSYDRRARLYDLRAPRCIFTLDHGAPVDDVHIMPGGAQAVTVGGLDVKVWDFFKGGRLHATLQSHAKATTAVAIDAPRRRLVSAGLDGFVKFHDLTTLEIRGVLPCQGKQLLDVAVSPDGKFVAVGTADGHLTVAAPQRAADAALKQRARVPGRVNELEGFGRGFVDDDKPTGPHPGTSRYFRRGPGESAPKAAVIVHAKTRVKLAEHDHALCKFDFPAALDIALKNQNPRIALSVLDELILRGSLRDALDRRSLDEVCPLLRYIRKHLRKPGFTARLTYTINEVLDLYARHVGTDDEFDTELAALLRVVRMEVDVCHSLKVLKGSVECVRRVSRRDFASQ